LCDRGSCVRQVRGASAHVASGPTCPFIRPVSTSSSYLSDKKLRRWLHECNYSPDVRFCVSVRPEGFRVNCLHSTSVSPLCVIMVLAAHHFVSKFQTCVTIFSKNCVEHNDCATAANIERFNSDTTSQARKSPPESYNSSENI
jgi:hypothetical protein